MGKRRSPKGANAPFNNPFAAVAAELAAKQKVPPPTRTPPVREKPVPPPELSDAELFASAVGALARNEPDPRGRAEPKEPPTAAELKLMDENAEALLELHALVDGGATFDISDSDEFIEGCAQGFDRRMLRKLKRGDFAVAAHLDLHGLTREPAKDAVLEFVTRCQKEGKRCVLIVHGRGKGSKDQIPILKNLLKGWLERGPIAKKILAFSTARPHDGGAGALYVLLRR